MTKTLAISGLVFLTNTAAAHAAVIYRMDSITTVGAGLFEDLVHRTSCLGPEDRYVATRRAAALRCHVRRRVPCPWLIHIDRADRGAERDIGRGERHQRPVPPDHSRQRHRFQPANGDQRRRELCDRRGHLPGPLPVNVECDHPRRPVGAGPEGRAGTPSNNTLAGNSVMIEVPAPGPVPAPPVPEPASLVLLGAGLLGVGRLGRRRRTTAPQQ